MLNTGEEHEIKDTEKRLCNCTRYNWLCEKKNTDVVEEREKSYEGTDFADMSKPLAKAGYYYCGDKDYMIKELSYCNEYPGGPSVTYIDSCDSCGGAFRKDRAVFGPFERTIKCFSCGERFMGARFQLGLYEQAIKFFSGEERFMGARFRLEPDFEVQHACVSPTCSYIRELLGGETVDRLSKAKNPLFQKRRRMETLEHLPGFFDFHSLVLEKKRSELVNKMDHKKIIPEMVRWNMFCRESLAELQDSDKEKENNVIIFRYKTSPPLRYDVFMEEILQEVQYDLYKSLLDEENALFDQTTGSKEEFKGPHKRPPTGSQGKRRGNRRSHPPPT